MDDFQPPRIADDFSATSKAVHLPADTLSRGVHHVIDGVFVAIQWLTVIPVRGTRIALSRAVVGVAMFIAPFVGFFIGGVVATVAWCCSLTGLGQTPLAVGLIAVAAAGLMTRGMHLDGLADTADALGSFAEPVRARAIAKDSRSGAFAVVALVLVITLQAACIGTLTSRGAWVEIIVAFAVSRITVVMGCAAFDAAAPTGFGGMVARSQPWWSPLLWIIAVTAATSFVVPWPVIVGWAVALIISVVFIRHCVHRLGGLVGDVLGAAIEVMLVACLLVCTALC